MPALLAAVFLLSAGVQCVGQRAAPQPPEPVALQHARLIPQDADAFLFAPSLEEALGVLEASRQQFPQAGVLQALDGQWNRQLGMSLTRLETWQALGARDDAPMTLFAVDGQWAFVVQQESPSRLRKTLQDAARRHNLAFRHYRSQGFEMAELRQRPSATGIADAEVTRELLVAITGPYAIVIPSMPAPTSGEALAQRIIQLEDARRFTAVPVQRALVEQLASHGTFFGVLDPRDWLPLAEAGGHAHLLLDTLANQMRHVGLRAHYEPADQRLRLHLELEAGPDAPVLTTQLGAAPGELPMVEGLIGESALAVIRLSFSPTRLWDFLRASLPAQQSAELEQMFTRLQEELTLDIRRDLLENLAGHMVVVVYGLDPKALPTYRESAGQWLVQALQLRATREAVFLPVNDRKAAARVLDALTQLSRGKLRRQVVRHTTQYAWFEDGQVEWALIMTNDAMIFVDSATAGERAASYEHTPQALGAAMQRAGLVNLLSDRDRSGLFVDTASLASLLSEHDPTGISSWLRPFESAMLISDESQNPAAATVELVLSGPPRPLERERLPEVLRDPSLPRSAPPRAADAKQDNARGSAP